MIQLLPLFALGLPSPAPTGLHIEYQTLTEDGQPRVSYAITVQGDAIRMDLSNPAIPLVSATLFDGQRLRLLDPPDSIYSDVTNADLQAAAAQRSPDPAHESTFAKTKGHERIAGVDCETYKWLRDGQDHGTVCFTPWKSGVVPKETLAPLGTLLERTAPLGKLAMGDLQLADYDTWPGWPLSTRSPDGRETWHVTSITRGPIPEGELQVPSDYRRKPLKSSAPKAP
jgi:Domain of unknown function (DUF4412)